MYQFSSYLFKIDLCVIFRIQSLNIQIFQVIQISQYSGAFKMKLWVHHITVIFAVGVITTCEAKKNRKKKKGSFFSTNIYLSILSVI